ncbi:hypothetical protein DFH11DRAFT_81205 [Phellopilus nigrolimitatus]|nr:hypothetical protein DFH11DRAFT_81205 [Phellopilus nigrolimitatus]
MANVSTMSPPDTTKSTKRTTRSSIRHSLNLASVGKALADVMNKEGKDTDRRRSTSGLGSKDAAARRSSTVGIVKGGSILEPVQEGQSKNIAAPDLKTVTQSRRPNSSLQRAGRKSVDETGSKVTAPQQDSINRSNTMLRPRKVAPGSALPKYRPKSAIVESHSKKPSSPIHAGTRRKHSSSEEDRESRDSSSLGMTCAHVVHSPMERVSRPISPIPRRAAKTGNSPSAMSNDGEKPSPPRKVKDARDSPAASAPSRPKKTQKPSVSPVVKKSGLPRPSPGDSPRTTSSSPRTPTFAKNAASRYFDARTSGRESPSPSRGPSAAHGSPCPSSRKGSMKSMKGSESESNDNTPTGILMGKSPHRDAGDTSFDSMEVDDVELMLAGIASPTAPTPAIPRIRASYYTQRPETPSRSSLHPMRSTLGLSLGPSTPQSDAPSIPSLPPSRKSSPNRRPAVERSSIATWEMLADLSVEINASELGGGLITELDLPSTPGMLSPSPSMGRLDSDHEGLESPTPLTLPSPSGYTSISQVLLPAVTPSPAPAMHSLHSNSFYSGSRNGRVELPAMDSATMTMLKLQLASAENLAKERLMQMTNLEEQVHVLKDSRKRDERELATHVYELEDRLRETLAAQERERERVANVSGNVVNNDSIHAEAADSHAECRNALEERMRQAEVARQQAVSVAMSELAERERAERARLLLQVEKRQELGFAVRDAHQSWQSVREVADSELEAIRSNRETLAVLRAGLDFFEAQVHISRCIRIPPPSASRFHLA